MDGYRISQLAERVGVPATTLRYYETQDLLPARRTASGYRVYDDRDVDRLRFIGAAKTLGLSLDRIRDLLDVWQGGACRDVRDRLRPEIAEQITLATRRIAEFVEFRDQLTSAIDRLDGLPAKDTRCDPGCAFLASATDDRPAGRRRDAEEVEQVPVACSLDASEYADRAARWRAVLAGSAPTALPDGGVRVHVPAARAEEVAALVVAESRCCPFFTFGLTVSSTGVVLDAHAPPDAAPLLEELFGHRSPAPAC